MEENLSEETTQRSAAVSAADMAFLEEMAKAGILYGRKKSKTHPRMKRYIFGTRNSIEIFDLIQTLSAVEKAQEFLEEVVKKGGLVLLVGTQPAAKALVKNLASKFNFPYVIERWLGGTLTNFKILSQRISYYLKLKADRESGVLEKYTKKERLDFDREIEKLGINFSGLENLKKIPEAVIMVDTNVHETAVREANRLNIPVVALINSDANPDKIKYPIPANSSAKTSIEWIFQKFEAAIEKAQSEKSAEPKTAAKK